MDAKITKLRLQRLLSYDWIKIIASCIAVILVWSLIFTMTATAITPSQQFSVFNYQHNGIFSDSFYAHFRKTFTGDVFSYEVIELSKNDLAETGIENATRVTEARLSISEGDVIFIPHIDDPDTKIESEQENEPPTYQYKHTQTFFNNWYSYIANVDEYLQNLQTFLARYYEGDTLNEQKVIEDFDARCKRNKDKRFRKAKDIESGRGAELERIEKYHTAYKEFQGYLDSGLIELVPMEVKTKEGKVLRSGNFAVNLCPDKTRMENLTDIAYYEITTEEGKKQSAENMCVMFFDFEDVEDSFEYESLLYVNAVIRHAQTQG
ncbi:MAG: hypothetical protein E7381_01215 [Clostridiales bacterium]|nr:hypothetical protein [Clostridiales bacterium]